MANELVELGTIGKTVPASTYYKDIDIQSSSQHSGEQLTKAQSLLEKAKQTVGVNSFFPLIPESMEPGLMKSIRFPREKRLKAFAVVGCDELSLKWLEFRKAKLETLHAPVYVVQAQSWEQIEQLKSRYKGLTIVPSSSDSVGKELNVGSYPFLVTKDGVWQ